MRRRTRILLAILLSVLLAHSAVAIALPPDAGELTGFQVELAGQEQRGEEHDPELRQVQEVMSQVLKNYFLAMDPVRLAVGAIEGMSSAAGPERITADRQGDGVRLQAGEELMVVSLGRGEQANFEGLAVAYQFVRKRAPNVPSKELAYGAIDGVLSQLDPHSSFMPPEMYNEMQLETKGSFGGIGIQIAVKDRQLTIVTPIEGTPADRAGLEPGDKIVKIDGAPAQEMTLAEAVRRLRGPAGSKVTLMLLRQESRGPFPVTLTREIIALKPIKSVELEHAIGYIKIVSFSEQSGRDLHRAVQLLHEKGARGIILDLRGNHGGLFNESLRVAELFLSAGQIVVSTTSRLRSQSTEYKTTHPGPLLSVPVIVLVNKGSASASEIVAGALQDLKRALIVGSKTYGKGSVQTIIPLNDGSALRLTTAKYLTPRGRSIDGTGIEPDLLVLEQAEEKSSAKPAGQEQDQGRKREHSRMLQQRPRKIAEDDGDPTIVIGRRDTLDLQKDHLLALAWRTLQAAQGPDVDGLLSMGRALLAPGHGAALEAPRGSTASQ